MIIEWDEDKNRLLLKDRGISFEMVVQKILNKDILSDTKHPNIEKYPNQRIFIIEFDEYCYVVPYVQEQTKIFLKTIYPSRTITKKYLKKKDR